MHQPLKDATAEIIGSDEKKRNLRNAELSGNSLDDLEADWIDYKAIGAN